MADSRLLAVGFGTKGAMIVHTSSIRSRLAHSGYLENLTARHSRPDISPIRLCYLLMRHHYTEHTLIGVSGIRAESTLNYRRHFNESDIRLSVIRMRRLARRRANFGLFTNSSPFIRIIPSAVSRFVLLMSGPTHVCDSLSS